jgi:hypothetical protein
MDYALEIFLATHVKNEIAGSARRQIDDRPVTPADQDALTPE